jgi:GNAT superfamily N-acetyltransferase
MIQDFFLTLNAVKKVLAADFACRETDFEKYGITFCLSQELPGRRQFPYREKFLAMVSMGRGIIACCSQGRMAWAEARLSKLTRDEVYGAPAISLMNEYVKQDGQFMAGPDLKHICTKSIFQPYKPAGDIEINLVEDVKSLGLYGDKRFPNSLGHGANPHTPWMVAAVAKCGGQIAGVATASADCDVMWQIGVDTLPEYRNRGMGKAAVSAVTAYLLEHGVIPYYSTLESNTASRATAAALGYKPAWVELYARELKAEGGH